MKEHFNNHQYLIYRHQQEHLEALDEIYIQESDILAEDSNSNLVWQMIESFPPTTSVRKSVSGPSSKPKSPPRFTWDSVRGFYPK